MSGMGKVKVVLDKAGIRSFLKNETIPILVDVASRVKNRAGEGYDTHIGSSRANVSVKVITVSEDAKKDNLKNNTLLKSVR